MSFNRLEYDTCSYKQEIKESFDQHITSIGDVNGKQDLKNKYDSITSYLKNDMDDEKLNFTRAKFCEVTDMLDKHRKESFVDIFPELTDFYQEAKQRYDKQWIADDNK